MGSGVLSWAACLSHGSEDGVGELGGAAGAADIAGKALALGVDGFESFLYFVGRGFFVEMAQHQNGGLEQGCRIGYVLAGDVGGGAVHGFEDGAVVAEVG